eukprot:s12_g18.t1
MDGDQNLDSHSALPVSLRFQQHSSRSLSHQVPPEFLQGIPFRCLLASAGRPFKAEDSSGRGDLRQCLDFDAFISHDWQTSRWLKYGSLLLLFNAKAAAVATLLFSTAGGLLVQYKVLPQTDWAISIGYLGGYLVFVVFLVFWQNIRDLFVRPRLAFLDKLTIPQEDQKVKETCILGLAGFLKHSKKLVILWSESYIDRLWCVYEFVTFMRIHRGERPVQAIPVALPLLLLVHSAWWFAIRIMIFFIVLWTSDVQNDHLAMWLCSIGVFVMFLRTYPCQSFIGTRMTQTLTEINRKLRRFEVQAAKCSCCSKGHRTPNGELIPCDRELIYQSFSAWYDTEATEMLTGLDMFNTAVRQEYGTQILQACGGSRMIPLNLFSYVVFSMNTPFLIRNIPQAFIAAEQETSTWQFALVFTNYLAAAWAFVFPSMLMYLWANKIVWSQTDRWPMYIRIISAALVVCLTIGVGFVVRVSVLWAPRSSWIPLAVFSFFLILGLCLLQCRCWSKDEVPVSPMSAKAEVTDEDSDSFSI